MVVALGLLLSLQRLVLVAAEGNCPIQCLLKRTSLSKSNFLLASILCFSGEVICRELANGGKEQINSI